MKGGLRLVLLSLEGFSGVISAGALPEADCCLPAVFMSSGSPSGSMDGTDELCLLTAAYAFQEGYNQTRFSVQRPPRLPTPDPNASFFFVNRLVTDFQATAFSIARMICSDINLPGPPEDPSARALVWPYLHDGRATIMATIGSSITFPEQNS
jgi:hypothetical protein